MGYVLVFISGHGHYGPRGRLVMSGEISLVTLASSATVLPPRMPWHQRPAGMRLGYLVTHIGAGVGHDRALQSPHRLGQRGSRMGPRHREAPGSSLVGGCCTPVSPPPALLQSS